MDEDTLLEQFVASFEKLDEMIVYGDIDPVAAELAGGESDKSGLKYWRPLKVSTDRSLCDLIYARLPGRFPPLFERLVLSYRWAEVDLQAYRLLANPPGPDLSGLLGQMSKDRSLWESLIPAGLIQFGMGPDIDDDPVCFDTKSRKDNGDCRIVKVDQEEILGNKRVKVVAELAPSFEDLVRQTIRRAGELQPKA